MFSVIAGQSPLSGAPAFTSNAYTSIQSFIGFLNSSTTYTQPGVADPLNNLPGQSGYETADSSVTPDRRRRPYRVQLRHRPGAAARHGARPGAQLPGVLPPVRRPV